MTAPRLLTALVLAMTGCSFHDGDSGGASVPDPSPQPSPGGGSQSPPKVWRGPQKMSDVHVEPGGERVWIVHHAVADLSASPNVTTAHLAVWVPDTGELAEVLDTTDTLGKRILFLGNGRVLYVTQRGTDRDVFVTVDAIARRPLAQHTYPGDRSNFRVSPSGRAVLSTNKVHMGLHLLDTASLVDQLVSADIVGADDVAWAPGEDVLYALRDVLLTTQLVRYDLRTADLSAPLPRPTVIATDPGFYGAIAVSPDARYLAVGGTASDDSPQVTLIDTTTLAARTIAGESVSDFTRDGRAIVWQSNPDGTQAFRLVDPATGDSGPTVATTWLLGFAQALRSHDIVFVDGIGDLSQPTDEKPFMYHTGDGTRTETGHAALASLFERPGHDEIWMWSEYDAVLRRLDLATGVISDVVSGDDSVDYRAATDDIVIGSFAPSLRRLSMATGKTIGAPLKVPDPNDVPAPYRLDDQ